MAENASRATSGELCITIRAVPDCTVMTLMAWATMSCSSRAMASRSSITAWRANCSRLRASSAARARSAVASATARPCRSPTSQTTAKTTAFPAIVSNRAPEAATATTMAAVAAPTSGSERRGGR
jgi:hypothetical protein